MFKKIVGYIKPFYFLLLIPFFLLHNINYYFGLIPSQLILSSLFAYLALSAAIYLFSKAVFKDDVKAGIYSFILMSFFFGFGAFKDSLEANSFFHRFAAYSYLLPAILIISSLLFFYLKKSRQNFRKLNTFLFLAVTVNLLVEGFIYSKNILNHAEEKNDLGDRSLSISSNYTPCSDCKQPDIFFIIFDEYSSSASLKKYFNYDNSAVDSFLLKNNFFISRESRSNYCFTSFSISATLKMDYLNLPANYKEADARDLARGEYTVYNNNVVKILEKQGYEIHNNSIFDIKNYPSALGTYFFPLRKMFLNDETLLGRTKRDIGWNLIRFKSKEQQAADINQQAIDNAHLIANNFNTAFQLAKQTVQDEDPDKKDFFYFHFMLPHDPYIYDSSGNLKYYTDYGLDGKYKYIEQLKYTNRKLKEIIDFIQEHYKGQAVILLQGDHGYKQWPGDPDFWDIAFSNLNAIYLPDKDYRSYYGKVTSVNTFRLLFNHLFNSHFGILPDNSIPVFVKKDLKKNYGIKQDEK